jgi:hypothetical protein
MVRASVRVRVEIRAKIKIRLRLGLGMLFPHILTVLVNMTLILIQTLIPTLLQPKPDLSPKDPSPRTLAKKAKSLADVRANANSFQPDSSSQLSSNFPLYLDSRGSSSWSECSDNSNQTSGNPQTSDGVKDFLDIRSQRWVVFGRVWNEIVNKMRDTDHISNTEHQILLFSVFDWLSKPIYLPLFQTAGCVETSMYALKEAAVSYLEEIEPQKKLLVLDAFSNSLDVTTKEAVAELWELLGWLFQRLLGTIHQEDVSCFIRVIGQWASSDDIFSRINADGLTSIVSLTGGLGLGLGLGLMQIESLRLETGES